MIRICEILFGIVFLPIFLIIGLIMAYKKYHETIQEAYNGLLRD